MSKDTEIARGNATVPGGRYTNHMGQSLSEQERKLTVYELQRERSDVFTELVQATEHEAKRQIITALYIHDGIALYDDLDDIVTRHRSNIKKHVAKLDKAGIVDRSGNPAVVSFIDSDVALLAADTLHVTDPL